MPPLPDEAKTRWYKSDEDNYNGRWVHRAFVIVPTNEVTQDMVDVAIQNDITTLRKSLDESQSLLKFRCTNDTAQDPSAFDGYTKYSHPDIIATLAGSEWTEVE